MVAGQGGHLVVGPRTGYADEEARARREVQPARLAEAAGVWYEEFANLTGELALQAPEGSPLQLEAGAAAVKWADGLNVDDADAAVRLHDYVARRTRQSVAELLAAKEGFDRGG